MGYIYIPNALIDLDQFTDEELQKGGRVYGDIDITPDDLSISDAIEILSENSAFISKGEIEEICDILDITNTNSIKIQSLADEMKFELIQKTFNNFTQDQFEEFLKSKNINF